MEPSSTEPEQSDEQPPKPSGKFCKGYTFDLPNIALTGGNGATVRYAARTCRWCIWDGRLSEPQENGTECVTCGRTVQDSHLGTVPIEHINFTHAVAVYLERVASWMLVEVAELPPIVEE